MRAHAWTLCWVLAAVSSQTAAWELTAAPDLETKLMGEATAVVAFIDPSSAVAKALEPAWLDAAASTPSAAFLSVDCTVQLDTCQRYSPSSSASIQLVRRGSSMATYQGPRRASAITAWVDRVQRPVVSKLSAESEGEFESIDETVLIAYIPPSDAASRAAFEEVALRYYHEFTFGILDVPEHQWSQRDGMPNVKCYRPLDKDMKVHSGPLAIESLEMFVKEASRPVIGELLPSNHQRFLDRGWPMVYVFATTESERAEMRQTLNKMARGQYDSLTMVTVDPLDFPELPAKLGLELGAYPAGAVHQLSSDKIFRYPAGRPITASALQKWGLDVWQGRVQPWYPPGSTPIPEPEAQGRIKASRKVSMKSFPGVKINIGRDEL